MTYQLIYSSVSSALMQRDELEVVLEQARKSNDRQKITGALVYVDGCFLQVLEGEKTSIERLMEKIIGDVRHEKVTILQEQEISSAAFSKWDMAYVSATSEQIAEWLGGSTSIFSTSRSSRRSTSG